VARESLVSETGTFDALRPAVEQLVAFRTTGLGDARTVPIKATQVNRTGQYARGQAAADVVQAALVIGIDLRVACYGDRLRCVINFA
jgi:hypothetical protein